MARGTKKGADHPRMLLTEETQNRICELIQDGQTVKGALAICGINRNTYRGWRKHARDGKQPFAAFIERVEVSKEHLKGELLKRIKDARQGRGEYNIAGAIWYLERIFADEFGSKQAIEARAAVLADQQAEELIGRLWDHLNDDSRRAIAAAWERVREAAPATDKSADGATVH